MNVQRLKQAERNFLERYPGGFAHPEMQAVSKKHQVAKMTSLARELFAPEEFLNPIRMTESMTKFVSRSSLVSVFEKPKFRDFLATLDQNERKAITGGLRAMLHGKERERQTGFESMLEILRRGKLGKWSLMTVIPSYYHPAKEVFCKPTTVKNVIRYFELEGLEYKPSPTYEFYKKYRAAILEMKKVVDPSLTPDNAHFSGFLMISYGD